MMQTIKFNDKNCLKFDYQNSDNSVKTIYRNDKPVYSFKGACKCKVFFNKKNEVDGVVAKVKDVFGNVYYLAFSSDKNVMRKSEKKCFEIIPTLVKDVKNRINDLITLKVGA